MAAPRHADHDAMRIAIEGGSSLALVAEQFGLSDRHVRRLCEKHGWGRAPVTRQRLSNVEVPAWVPPNLVRDYRAIATRGDEFRAARWARSMKRRMEFAPR